MGNEINIESDENHSHDASDSEEYEDQDSTTASEDEREDSKLGWISQKLVQ